MFTPFITNGVWHSGQPRLASMILWLEEYVGEMGRDWLWQSRSDHNGDSMGIMIYNASPETLVAYRLKFGT